QQQQSPSSQPIWRKTILVNKPKPKTILPRIFRTDRKTGLPLDYERTVSKIMRYVNPQASKSHSPDQLMEELLSQTLVGYLESYNRTNGCVFKHHMHMILQNRGLNAIDKDVRNDENLLEFHCAWLVTHSFYLQDSKKNITKIISYSKRKPLPSANIVPTYQSKFNYNNLKIKSK
ncbi:hypothetical protein KR044_003326, partial [Drosophila immigrans]